MMPYKNLMQLAISSTMLVSGTAIAQRLSVTRSGSTHKPYSQWVYPGNDGKLIYKTTPAGDRIMDFSYAGYMGGGIALPAAPVCRTVSPSGGPDDTQLIQSAIDAVSAMPAKNGLRGTIRLAAGDFTCAGTIYIPVGGIILQGSGSGPGGTTIHMTGGRHAAIMIGAGI